jgi:hypothetical protein
VRELGLGFECRCRLGKEAITRTETKVSVQFTDANTQQTSSRRRGRAERRCSSALALALASGKPYHVAMTLSGVLVVKQAWQRIGWSLFLADRKITATATAHSDSAIAIAIAIDRHLPLELKVVAQIVILLERSGWFHKPTLDLEMSTLLTKMNESKMKREWRETQMILHLR